jgi:hypothetical protein
MQRFRDGALPKYFYRIASVRVAIIVAALRKGGIDDKMEGYGKLAARALSANVI